MKKERTRKAFVLPVVLSLGMLAAMAGHLFAPYWTCGCTPGYWKNHLDQWTQTNYLGVPLEPTQPVGSVFAIPGNLSALADDTLLRALSYPGGPGLAGAARILLRAATAGLLNFTHVGLNNINSVCRGYHGFYHYYCAPEVYNPEDGNLPCMINNLVTEVNAALQSQNRDTMIYLASQIDIDNNTTCPLAR
jgi:hypothetical protein